MSSEPATPGRTRRAVDWPAVLTWLDEHPGEGPRAAARALGYPEGTILAGYVRERARRSPTATPATGADAANVRVTCPMCAATFTPTREELAADG